MKYLVCFLISILFFSFPSYAVELPPQGAIASAAPQATQAGLEMLNKGGNAFDAAVAVASTLAVVEPYASGMGGGGFWLLYSAKDNTTVFLDAREMAPSHATADMYVNNPSGSLNGPLAAAIPGEPAALVLLAKRYGKLPLTVTLAPAIKLAKEGFLVDKLFQDRVQLRLDVLRTSSEASNIFLHEQEIPPMGYKIIQKDLAHTLGLLAQKGMNGFYAGEVAQKLVDGVRVAGGIWTMADLQNYRLYIRKPLIGHYGNMTLTTTGLPSGGGISLVSMLKMLSFFNWTQFSFLNRVQLNIEIMRRAFWDRMLFLGDPEFVNVPVNEILSSEHTHELVASIIIGKATLSKNLQPKTDAPKVDKHTTHYSILDKEGNRVAATLSNNYYFGSGFIPAGTGVLLNDEMDDFATTVKEANVFEVAFSKPNNVAPGKRPLSSMTPLFLETPDKLAIMGAPGGSFIPTMLFLAIEDFLLGHLPSSWVALQRYHHQYLPDEIKFEPNTFNAEEQLQLKKMGYTLQPLTRNYGDMQAILWDKKQDKVYAASDPRRKGKAVVF